MVDMARSSQLQLTLRYRWDASGKVYSRKGTKTEKQQNTKVREGRGGAPCCWSRRPHCSPWRDHAGARVNVY